MKDKNRLTIMVCTSATGDKVPLAVIGKPIRPQCWDLCGNKPPIAYNNQNNAWFDRTITICRGTKFHSYFIRVSYQ